MLSVTSNALDLRQTVQLREVEVAWSQRRCVVRSIKEIRAWYCGGIPMSECAVTIDVFRFACLSSLNGSIPAAPSHFGFRSRIISGFQARRAIGIGSFAQQALINIYSKVPEEVLRFAEEIGLWKEVTEALCFRHLEVTTDVGRALLGTLMEASDSESTPNWSVVGLTRDLWASMTPDQIAEQSPGKNVRSVKKAQLWHGFLVIEDRNLTVFDANADPRLRAVAGQESLVKVAMSRSGNAVLQSAQPCVESIDAGILLGGRLENVWYHCLIDYLPRLRFITSVDPAIPILIRADACPQFREALQVLTERRVILLDPKVVYEIGTLLVVRGSSSVRDLPLSTRDLEPRLCSESMNWLRDRISALQLGGVSEETDQENLLVLHRTGTARRVVGFGITRFVTNRKRTRHCKMARVSFESQVSVFAEARTVIACGGSDLANLLLMNRRARVLGLTGIREPRPILWREVAQVLGLDYTEANLRVLPALTWAQRAVPSWNRTTVVSPKVVRAIWIFARS